MAYQKYQRYYVKSVFTNNEISTNDNLYIKFKNNFKIKLELANKKTKGTYLHTKLTPYLEF